MVIFDALYCFLPPDVAVSPPTLAASLKILMDWGTHFWLGIIY